MITWTATDWCCAEELPEREYEFTQKVIGRIDPECVLNGGEDVSLVQGSVHSELGSVIDEVTVRAIPESGSALSVVTSGEGLFEFSVPTHTNMSLIPDRKSTRLNSSHVAISYAVFCLNKNNIKI